MSEDREYVSESEARRLWRQAAQLQAEAASRAEALGSGVDEDATAERSVGAKSGYPLTQVRAAALEAGIAAEFVDAAISDLRAEQLAGGASPTRHPVAGRILGKPPSDITVRRLVRATPHRVLDAMEAVLPHDPFALTLVDRHGDPAAGGVLTFGIPPAPAGGLQGGFAFDLRYAGLRTIHVSVAPGTAADTSELTVRAPLAVGWRLSAVVSSGFTTVGGGLGVGAAFVAAALLFPVAAPVAIAAEVALGLVGARAGLGAARSIYRYGLGRAGRALTTLASAVAAQAEGGWFGKSVSAVEDNQETREGVRP